MSPNQPPFDLHRVDEVTVLVTTPSTDSSSSIGTGSPTLLILDPSLRDARRSSVGSFHGTPTVKFAPLPEIDPNKKRSLAPLGVPGRSRRKRVTRQEGESLLWSADLDVPEDVEDPLISFAKFVKKTGKTLWRRARKGSRVVPQENVACSAEPVLDIKSTTRSGDMAVRDKGECVAKAMGLGLGDKRGHRASWSPVTLAVRTLSWEKARKSTSDLTRFSVVP